MKITSFGAFCATVAAATVALIAAAAGPAQAVTYTTTVDTGYRGLCIAIGGEADCDVFPVHAVYVSAIAERKTSTSVTVSGRVIPYIGSVTKEGTLVIKLKNCSTGATTSTGLPSDITGITSTLTRSKTFTGLSSTTKYAAYVTSNGALQPPGLPTTYWSQWNINLISGGVIKGATMTSPCV